MDDSRKGAKELTEAPLRAGRSPLILREKSPRTAYEADRIRGLRARHEALERLEWERQEYAGLLPCPECGLWSTLRDDTTGDVRCSHCGTPVDFCALYALTGVWKLHVVFLVLFTGLAALLVGLAVYVASELWLKSLLGLVAIGPALLSVPYWLYSMQQILWRWRSGRGTGNAGPSD